MRAPPRWYESFFSGLAVEFWRAVIPPEITREEVGFLVDCLQLAPGSRVLDVPCGDGRLALELAAQGIRVTGVDISAEFVEAARRGAGQRGLEVEFSRGDMRELPGTGEFDSAFCFGNSFGYLDDGGNVEFLHAVGRALRLQGRFALSWGYAAESIFPNLKDRTEMEVAGFHFAEENRYEPQTGRVETRYTFRHDGRSETKLGTQRVYMLSELFRMLRDAGLEPIETFASTAKEPFRLASPVLLLVAERR